MTYFVEKIESPINFLLVDENILIDSCHTELWVRNSQLFVISILEMAAVQLFEDSMEIFSNVNDLSLMDSFFYTIFCVSFYGFFNSENSITLLV